MKIKINCFWLVILCPEGAGRASCGAVVLSCRLLFSRVWPFDVQTRLFLAKCSADKMHNLKADKDVIFNWWPWLVLALTPVSNQHRLICKILHLGQNWISLLFNFSSRDLLPRFNCCFSLLLKHWQGSFYKSDNTFAENNSYYNLKPRYRAAAEINEIPPFLTF